ERVQAARALSHRPENAGHGAMDRRVPAPVSWTLAAELVVHEPPRPRAPSVRPGAVPSHRRACLRHLPPPDRTSGPPTSGHRGDGPGTRRVAGPGDPAHRRPERRHGAGVRRGRAGPEPFTLSEFRTLAERWPRALGGI